jgi:hypothetical protein
MSCGCAEASEEVQRYHEMIGSCDVIPSGITNRYAGLDAVVDCSIYESMSRGYR